jgi:hypothetical protein
MQNTLNVRNLRPDETESARLFLGEHGWRHRTGDAESFARLIGNSQRTAIALLGDQIVGFARGITDEISNGYLSMVVVDAEHVMGDNPDITWLLRAGREGAEAFFTSLGFETSVIAMERPRQK